MLTKISIGINLLLIVAVGYLFLKIPGQKKTDNTDLKVASAFSDTVTVRAPVLAYVNGDSLNEQYDFIKEKRASLEEKMTISEKKLQGEIDKRKAEWDQNVQYAQNNKLTPDEEAAIQQRLEELSSEIEAIRQKEGEALRKKEEELQNELQKKVREFLDRYAKEKGIDYVINYQQGLNILLFTNSAYDVTNEVVKRLNVEYGHEKTSKSK